MKLTLKIIYKIILPFILIPIALFTENDILLITVIILLIPLVIWALVITFITVVWSIIDDF